MSSGDTALYKYGGATGTSGAGSIYPKNRNAFSCPALGKHPALVRGNRGGVVGARTAIAENNTGRGIMDAP